MVMTAEALELCMWNVCAGILWTCVHILREQLFIMLYVTETPLPLECTPIYLSKASFKLNLPRFIICNPSGIYFILSYSTSLILHPRILKPLHNTSCSSTPNIQLRYYTSSSVVTYLDHSLSDRLCTPKRTEVKGNPRIIRNLALDWK
jgi:hypothetical protein